MRCPECGTHWYPSDLQCPVCADEAPTVMYRHCGDCGKWYQGAENEECPHCAEAGHAEDQRDAERDEKIIKEGK